MSKTIKKEDLNKHQEEQRAKREPAPVRYQPNITPLIDVLFLLLLFFLLGTKFRQEEGQIPAQLPTIGAAASSAGGDLATNLQINVNPAGENSLAARYEFNNSVRSTDDPQELYTLLKAQWNVRPECTILIKVQSNTRWEFAVEAFNQAARAGFKKIGFTPIES